MGTKSNDLVCSAGCGVSAELLEEKIVMARVIRERLHQNIVIDPIDEFKLDKKGSGIKQVLEIG
jgi:hypothetical protein